MMVDPNKVHLLGPRLHIRAIHCADTGRLDVLARRYRANALHEALSEEIEKVTPLLRWPLAKPRGGAQ